VALFAQALQLTTPEQFFIPFVWDYMVNICGWLYSTTLDAMLA
jgi:hypothetical protein